MKCIYFNARSLVNKVSELEVLLSTESPEIVGVTETWLHNEIHDSEFSFDGYSLFRQDRLSNSKLKGGRHNGRLDPEEARCC